MERATGLRRARAGLAAVVLGTAAVAVPGGLLGGCTAPDGTGGGDGPAGAALGDTVLVRMTGADFQWHVRYPGPDGAFGSADDRHAVRHVHVPAGRPVLLELRSDDYIYTMALPHLGLKEIAVPDLDFALRFRVDEAGEHVLKGDQMCGYSHEDLIGTLVAEDDAAFADWLANLPEGPGRGR